VTKSTSRRPQFTLNNFIICLLIVNGRLPLSRFIRSVDEAGWLLWTQAVARWRVRRRSETGTYICSSLMFQFRPPSCFRACPGRVIQNIQYTSTIVFPMQLISKQQTGKKMIRDLQNMCSFCARTIANLIHVDSPGGSTSAR